MGKYLALGSDGKLVIKSSDGRKFPYPARKESSFSFRKAEIFLLVDCSGSMAGEKIEQVKQGVLDFSRTALRKGYSVGLVKFETEASLLCEPTRNFSLLSDKIKDFIANGSTNLAKALEAVSYRLKGQKGDITVVVATDGVPNDPDLALKLAKNLKRKGVEILAISTEDADRDFLAKLVSREGLNLRVERNEFGKGMGFIAKKLPVQFREYKR